MAFKLRTQTRKQELKQPDEFHRTVDELSDLVSSSRRTVITIGVTVVVLVVAGMGWFYIEGRKADESQTLFWNAEKSFREAQVGREGASAADRTAELSAAAEKFRQIAQDYSGTSSGPLAQIYLGNTQIEMGEYDAAIESYRRVVERYPRLEPIVELARLRLAYAAMMKGDSELAGASLEELASRSGGRHRDQALFELGRLMESQGKREEAITRYKEITTNHPESILAVEAMARLRNLGVSLEPTAPEVGTGDVPGPGGPIETLKPAPEAAAPQGSVPSKAP